ncbi:MAG: hypothetical protein HC923_04825 [Myxococcales bacterium]|nr:hypothetical protein [Myxococcales bacterium]
MRGHLYAIDSDVFVRRSAVVLGSITAIGGSFHVEDGAVLPATVELRGTELYGPDGRRIDAGTLRLAAGSTTVHLRPVGTSTLSLTLTRAVLPFSRFTPGAERSVADLEAWAPGLGMDAVPVEATRDELVIGGLIRLRVVSDRVLGTLQHGFRGARGKAMLTVLRLDSVESAEELWSRIEATKLEGANRVSIKSGLGDGNHWFVRSRGRATMIWQRGPWVLAVETQLAESSATLVQQLQFNRQVLASLERRLPKYRESELK